MSFQSTQTLNGIYSIIGPLVTPAFTINQDGSIIFKNQNLNLVQNGVVSINDLVLNTWSGSISSGMTLPSNYSVYELNPTASNYSIFLPPTSTNGETIFVTLMNSNPIQLKGGDASLVLYSIGDAAIAIYNSSSLIYHLIPIMTNTFNSITDNGTLTVNGQANFNNSTSSSSVSTGGAIFSGGIGVGALSYIEQLYIPSNVNPSGYNTPAALQISGGVSSGGNGWINGSINAWQVNSSDSANTNTFSGPLLISSTATPALTVSGSVSFPLQASNALTVAGQVNFTYYAQNAFNVTGIANFLDATIPSSNSTGAVVVTGGIAAGRVCYFPTVILAQSINPGSYTDNATISSKGGIVTGGNAWINGSVNGWVVNTTNSSSTSTFAGPLALTYSTGTALNVTGNANFAGDIAYVADLPNYIAITISGNYTLPSGYTVYYLTGQTSATVTLPSSGTTNQRISIFYTYTGTTSSVPLTFSNGTTQVNLFNNGDSLTAIYQSSSWIMCPHYSNSLWENEGSVGLTGAYTGTLSLCIVQQFGRKYTLSAPQLSFTATSTTPLSYNFESSVFPSLATLSSTTSYGGATLQAWTDLTATSYGIANLQVNIGTSSVTVTSSLTPVSGDNYTFNPFCVSFML